MKIGFECKRFECRFMVQSSEPDTYMRKEKPKSLLLFYIILMAYSIGIYQINFCFNLGMIILCLLNDMIRVSKG